MEKAKQPIRFVLSSLASVLADNGLFYVLELFLGPLLGSYATPVCYLIARACSSFLNFNLNNRLVFQNQGNYGKALLKYYCLAVPVAFAGTGLTTLFSNLFHIQSALGNSAVKLVVDSVLFVVNYFIQKFWVFSKTDSKKES